MRRRAEIVFFFCQETKLYCASTVIDRFVSFLHTQAPTPYRNMKVQSCKAKGRRLQQTIVKDLLSVFPSLNEDDIRSTSMGANGEDVLLSSAAKKEFPYSVEAKNQERLNIWSAIEQAKANSNGLTPIVVMKRNNEVPHVVMNWKSFLELVAKKEVPKVEVATNPVNIPSQLRSIASLLEESTSHATV